MYLDKDQHYPTGLRQHQGQDQGNGRLSQDQDHTNASPQFCPTVQDKIGSAYRIGKTGTPQIDLKDPHFHRNTMKNKLRSLI